MPRSTLCRKEGFVVVDARFRRVKVKHPGYVALHHAIGGMSPRAFVEIARKGETSEVEAAFPELAEQIQKARDAVNALVVEVETDYARLAHHETQKAFALDATKTRCSAALFMLRAKKTPSVRDWLAQVPIDSAMRLLGYRTDVSAKEAFE